MADAEVKKLTILAQLLCTETDEAGGCGVSPFPLVPTWLGDWRRAFKSQTEEAVTDASGMRPRSFTWRFLLSDPGSDCRPSSTKPHSSTLPWSLNNYQRLYQWHGKASVCCDDTCDHHVKRDTHLPFLKQTVIKWIAYWANSENVSDKWIFFKNT